MKNQQSDKLRINKLEKTLLGIYLVGTAIFVSSHYGFDNETINNAGFYPSLISGSMLIGYRWGRKDKD